KSGVLISKAGLHQQAQGSLWIILRLFQQGVKPEMIGRGHWTIGGLGESLIYDSGKVPPIDRWGNFLWETGRSETSLFVIGQRRSGRLVEPQFFRVQACSRSFRYAGTFSLESFKLLWIKPVDQL